MRFFVIVIALVASASAQDINSLPLCAQSCMAWTTHDLPEAEQTACAADIAACICTSDFQQKVLDCLNMPVDEGGCNSEDQATTIESQKQFCDSASGSEPAGPSETTDPSGSSSVGGPSASPSGSVGGPSGSNSGSTTRTNTRSVPNPSATTPPGDAASRVSAGLGTILAAAGLVMVF